ncbi:MAG: hypothetical protein KAR40_07930 [Candidatus Sabulitectum sp.]|nr:hypothetical protein [Candidatus Sabulitectum sp.]
MSSAKTAAGDLTCDKCGKTGLKDLIAHQAHPSCARAAEAEAKVAEDAAKAAGHVDPAQVSLDAKAEARKGAEETAKALLAKQQAGKDLKREELAKIAEAKVASEEAAKKQAIKVAGNRERVRAKIEKAAAKAAKIDATEAIEIAVRKSEAKTRRTPVFATREENRAGLLPHQLHGEALAIDRECDRMLQHYNMIINSPDGFHPDAEADPLA